MSKRAAFVRELGTALDEHWASLESAERAAQGYARTHKGRSYYTGYIGSDPREHARWQWDDGWKDAVKFACND